MTDACARSKWAQNRSTVGKAYVATERSLKRFIGRFCTDQSEVEDIAQETLLNAMKAEAGQQIESPKAYLYQVARNLVIRSHARRSREIIGYVEDLDLAETPCPTPSVEDQVISRERLGILCEAIEDLPPSCRKVFVLRKVYGYSHKEIAERLGISTSTVEKHLATGFARCVAFMRRQESEASDEPAVGAMRARVS